MSLRFVSYARKSSQGESKQIESIQDQEKVLAGLAERDSLLVVTTLWEAKSAKEPHKRPVYRAMIDMILAGEADAILCWHLNRLSRNPMESGELQWLLQTGRIKCIKTPEREYRPEDHALLMAVESSMATQYVRDLKRDVSRGVQEKVERGWYPFKAKAGYLVDPITKELKIDPVRYPLLERAWGMLLTRAYSVPQILTELNAWGYRSPKTKSGGEQPMTRSGLYRLFTDSFYAGFYTYQGALYQSRHQAMITPEQFDAAQAILSGKQHAKPEMIVHEYAGLIECGDCGCQVTAETHLKRYQQSGISRSYTYYHCTGRRGCRKLSNTEDNLEEQLLANLMDVRLDPDFIDWALDVLRTETPRLKGQDAWSQGAVSASEATIQTRIDRLFTMRENDEISADEFTARKARYVTELTKLAQARTTQANKEIRDRKTLENILTFTRDWYDRYTSGIPGAKRQVASVYASRYVLTQGTLTATCHPALNTIRTFERTKNPDQQIGPGLPLLQIDVWRTMWDELRTAVEESKEPFEGLSALPQPIVPVKHRQHRRHRRLSHHASEGTRT